MPITPPVASVLRSDRRHTAVPPHAAPLQTERTEVVRLQAAAEQADAFKSAMLRRLYQASVATAACRGELEEEVGRVLQLHQVAPAATTIPAPALIPPPRVPPDRALEPSWPACRVLARPRARRWRNALHSQEVAQCRADAGGTATQPGRVDAAATATRAASTDLTEGQHAAFAEAGEQQLEAVYADELRACREQLARLETGNGHRHKASSPRAHLNAVLGCGASHAWPWRGPCRPSTLLLALSRASMQGATRSKPSAPEPRAVRNLVHRLAGLQRKLDTTEASWELSALWAWDSATVG